jgi:hypothetical protein
LVPVLFQMFTRSPAVSASDAVIAPKCPGACALVVRRVRFRHPLLRSAVYRAGPAEAAPVDNPGTTRRPGNPGVQYVDIPQQRR